MHFMRGIDHALGCVVGGLKTFKTSGVAPTLCANETRYMQERKRKLDGVPPNVPQLRSTVWNRDTKVAKWDLPGNNVGSCLALVGDEGLKDYLVFLYFPANKH